MIGICMDFVKQVLMNVVTDDVGSLFQQIGELRVEARDKEIQVKEKEHFLESEVDNNREIEKKFLLAERMYARQKQELQDAEKLRDTFNGEVSTWPITWTKYFVKPITSVSVTYGAAVSGNWLPG